MELLMLGVSNRNISLLAFSKVMVASSRERLWCRTLRWGATTGDVGGVHLLQR